MPRSGTRKKLPAVVDGGETITREGKYPFSDVGIIFAVTAVVINMILTASASSALVAVADGSFTSLDSDKVLTIWHAFRLTAPLTIALGFLLLAWFQGWWSGMTRGFVFTGLLVLTTWALMPESSEVLARAKGAFVDQPGPWSFTLSLLASYATIYWWKPLVCCVLLALAFGGSSYLLLNRISLRSGKLFRPAAADGQGED